MGADDLGNAAGAFSDSINGVSAPLGTLKSKLRDATKEVNIFKEALGGVGVGLGERLAGSLVNAAANISEAAIAYGDAAARLEAAVGSSAGSEGVFSAVSGLFSEGWGSSLDGLVSSALEARDILGALSTGELETVLRTALTLEQTFGIDVSESLRTVDWLMSEFGVSASEACDLAVASAQYGIDYTEGLGNSLIKYAGAADDAAAALEQSTSQRVGSVTRKLTDLFVPLSDSLIDIGTIGLDYIEPVIDEFRSWDEGTQKVVLGAAALAVGIPKVASAYKALRVSMAGASAAQVALNAAMKSNLFGLILAGAAMLIGSAIDAKDAFVQAREESRRVEQAANGLGETLDAVTAESMGNAAGGAVSLAQKIDQASESTRELSLSTAGLYDGIALRVSTVETQTSRIQELAASIGELSAKESLTETEQRALAAAVEEFNELTGASISVLDEQTGELSENAEAVDEIADAQGRRLRAEAYNEALSVLYEQQAVALDGLAQAQENAAAAAEELARAQAAEEEARKDPFIMSAPELYGQYQTALSEASAANDVAIAVLDEATATYDGITESIATCEETLYAQGDAAVAAAQSAEEMTLAEEEAAQAAEEAAEQQKRLIEEMVAFADETPGLREAVEATGMSLGDFALALETTGYGMDQFREDWSNLSDVQNPFDAYEYDPETFNAQNLLDGLAKNTQVVSEWSENLQTLWANAQSEADRAFIQYLQDMGVDSATIMQNWIDGIGPSYEECRDAYWANQQALNSSIVENAAAATGLAYEAGAQAPESMGQGALDNADAASAGGSAVGDALVGSVGDLNWEMEERGRLAGENLGYGFGTADVSDDTATLVSALAASLAGVPAAMTTLGSLAGTSFATGLTQSIAEVYWAGWDVGTVATSALQTASANAWTWGNDMGVQFAAGLAAAHENVVMAAAGLAMSAATYLHHSTPDKGPLAGDDTWGLEMAQNFASGMLAGVSNVEDSAEALARAALFARLTDASTRAIPAASLPVAGAGGNSYSIAKVEITAKDAMEAKSVEEWFSAVMRKVPAYVK